MKARAFGVLFSGAVLLVIALSTGERLYLLLALVLGCMFVFSLLSALWALLSLSVAARIPDESIPRGSQLTILLRVRHRCPLPVAPLRLLVNAPEGLETLRVSMPLFREQMTRISVHCPHVGYFQVGIHTVAVEDVFGLFALSSQRHRQTRPLYILPVHEPIEPLRFNPGEYESETISRATEDASSPSGVRGYQQGDALRKVHWKLSLRKREILIKTFDQPMRPDALVLVDCMPPEEGVYRPWIQDRLCDLAASVCASLAEGDAALRMPLTGQVPEDVIAAGTDALQRACMSLAAMNFSGVTSLERVLLLEAQRMRRSGATVVLTSQLSSQSTELILRLHRLGPFVRVYLVVERLLDHEQAMIQCLLQNNIACFVEMLGVDE